MEENQFPNVFAVLGDLESSRTEIALFTVERVESIQKIVPIDVYFPVVFRIINNPAPLRMYRTTTVNDSQELQITKYWYTGRYMIPTSDSGRSLTVPIFDFENRSYFETLWPQLQKVQLNENSVELMIQNQSHQRRIRNELLQLLQRVSEQQVAEQPPPFDIPRRVAEVLIHNLIESGASCAISTEPFSQCNEISITPCYHYFQRRALETWLSSHRNCPECRGPVFSVYNFMR